MERVIIQRANASLQRQLTDKQSPASESLGIIAHLHELTNQLQDEIFDLGGMVLRLQQGLGPLKVSTLLLYGLHRNNHYYIFSIRRRSPLARNFSMAEISVPPSPPISKSETRE